MTLTLTPQNPILKVYSADDQTFVDQTFAVVVSGDSPPTTWTWSFKNRDLKIIDSDGNIIETESILTNSGASKLIIKAPRFIIPGRYMLSVTAKYGDPPLSSETQSSEMQVVPSDIDERDSFIAYGANCNYYLVALSFKGRQIQEDKQVIQLTSIREGQSVIPEGFTADDVGCPAPLARSVPKTIGVAFITCVMLNLKSKDNHKLALLSEKEGERVREAITGKPGFSFSGGKK